MVNSPLIRTEALCKDYRSGESVVCALQGVSLTIEPGEFVMVMGPSGSGKSTLLGILGLLDAPTSGRYWLAGHNTARLHPDQRAALRNREIGFVFQGYNLLPRNSALENVELPLVYRGLAAGERRTRAVAALDAVGLASRAGHWPQQLSGGEQQRVAVARALVTEPTLLLADEPTGSVDTRAGEQIMALFAALHRSGMTIVLITHNPELAAFADRVLQIRDGRIAAPLESRSRRLAMSAPARA